MVTIASTSRKQEVSPDSANVIFGAANRVLAPLSDRQLSARSIGNRADGYRQALSKLVVDGQAGRLNHEIYTALNVLLRSVSICIVDDEGII
jgi:hypothetical protein